jgi:hypothetical protein
VAAVAAAALSSAPARPLVIAGGGGASPSYQGGGYDGIAASTSFSGTDGGGSIFHSGKGGNSLSRPFRYGRRLWR